MDVKNKQDLPVFRCFEALWYPFYQYFNLFWFWFVKDKIQRHLENNTIHPSNPLCNALKILEKEIQKVSYTTLIHIKQ